MTWSRSILSLLVAALSIALCPAQLTAAPPLIEQSPFDVVTLNAANGNTVLKVLPLELPGRKLPEPIDPTQNLELRLVDRPGQLFTVQWQHVAKVQLFEQVVLSQADQLTAATKYDEAFPIYQFLEARYPEMPGLKDSVERYLMAQVLDLFKAQKFDESLALLVELAARNPQRAGLSTAYERVTDKLVEQHVAAGKYTAARGLLGSLAAKFPDAMPTVTRWQDQLKQQADALVAKARADQKAGKTPLDLQFAAQQALERWPASEAARTLAREAQTARPLVRVGVTSSYDARSTSWDDWALRRTCRLVARPLVELVVGDEGLAYQSAFGKLEQVDPSHAIYHDQTDTKPGASTAAFTGLNVARSLMDAADPTNRLYDPAWADRLVAIEVHDVRDVHLEFRGPIATPEAWLRQAVYANETSVNSDVRTARADYSVGPSADPQRAVGSLKLTLEATSSPPTQPRKVKEVFFADSHSALSALRRGTISAIDRVDPWDLAAARSIEGVTLVPYAVPSVHVLVPNYRKPLLQDRAFRRALVYGIDRASILNRSLLAGKTVAGCSVLSGPFAEATKSGGFFGTAFNKQVEARSYDPAVALVLARKSLAAVSKSQDTVKLTLVHGPQAIQRVACESIRLQLNEIGIGVQLKELAPGEPLGQNFDLAYLELAMWEPAVDVQRLFHERGPAGGCPAEVARMLIQLQEASDRDAASTVLKELHRVIHEQSAIIPLWQLADFAAVHNSVQGAGQKVTTLYQNIESWQVDVRLPK